MGGAASLSSGTSASLFEWHGCWLLLLLSAASCLGVSVLERAAAFGLRIGFLCLENGWFYNGRRRLSLQVARVLSPAFDCECALGFMCSLRAPDLHVQSGQPERTAASGLRVGTLGLVLGLETGVVLACETRHLSMSRAWAHWGPRVVVKSDGSA